MLTQHGYEGDKGVPGEGEGADQERADAEQPQRVHGQAPGDHSH